MDASEPAGSVTQGSIEHAATSWAGSAMVAHVNVLPGSTPWLRLARVAKLLAALTLIWLGIEGTIGVIAGILAGSIALVAFGLDSAIEGLASVIVIWRFTGTRTISADAERRAQKWVAISFFLLAPYIAAEAVETLIEGAAAETSWLGIGLTAGTLVLCPWLGRAKQRIGEKLGSRATYGEGTQNVLCAMLAGAVARDAPGRVLGLDQVFANAGGTWMSFRDPSLSVPGLNGR